MENLETPMIFVYPIIKGNIDPHKHEFDIRFIVTTSTTPVTNVLNQLERYEYMPCLETTDEDISEEVKITGYHSWDDRLLDLNGKHTMQSMVYHRLHSTNEVPAAFTNCYHYAQKHNQLKQFMEVLAILLKSGVKLYYQNNPYSLYKGFLYREINKKLAEKKLKEFYSDLLTHVLNKEESSETNLVLGFVEIGLLMAKQLKPQIIQMN